MIKSRSISFATILPYMPWLLALLWALMQVGVYYAHGVQVVFDSHRYIAEAGRLLETGDLGQVTLSHISYAIVLAASMAAFGTAESVVLPQLAVAALSTIAFYKLGFVLLQNRGLAFFATCFLLLWPLYQHWNFYVHTESLFASVTIIAFWRAATASSKWHYFQLLLLLLFVTLLRANGFMMVLAVMAYVAAVYWLKKGLSFRLLLFSSLAIGAAVVVVLGQFFLRDVENIYSFSGHLLSGNVIQGYNKISFVPEGEPILTGSPVEQIVQLVWQEPVFFLKKSLGRVFFYWSQMRPYISLRYKLVIAVYIYPLYLLAAAALWKRKLPMPFIFAVSVLFTLFTVMVIASSVDWDNRFMMPLLPFIFLCAAAGLKTFGTWQGAILYLAKGRRSTKAGPGKEPAFDKV